MWSAALLIISLIAFGGLVGFYILNQQSKAISNKSIAIATGSAAATTAANSNAKHNHNTIVIAGPMGAGKTSLWCRLRFPSTKKSNTQTSMSINAAEAHIDESTAYMVDIPGHQKYQFDRDSYLPLARGIIFVVDSTAIADNIRGTTEMLYSILANQAVQTKELPVLVLCNKQDDSATAVSHVRIKTMLEEEINSLRASRQAGLTATTKLDDDEDTNDKLGDFLGYDGQKFSFEHLPNTVQINESSMILGHDAGGLEQVERWIADTLHS